MECDQHAVGHIRLKILIEITIMEVSKQYYIIQYKGDIKLYNKINSTFIKCGTNWSFKSHFNEQKQKVDFLAVDEHIKIIHFLKQITDTVFTLADDIQNYDLGQRRYIFGCLGKETLNTNSQKSTTIYYKFLIIVFFGRQRTHYLHKKS